MTYRGRFAPSPTGDLHFGSLVAALGTWLDARAAGGAFIVRMEDVDEARAVEGADRRILATLAAFGMASDEPVIRQSERKAHYESALARLVSAGHAFACHCSRSELGAALHRQCIAYAKPGRAPAWRVRAPAVEVAYVDRLQGPQRQNLADEVGDFVVQRADGYFAYQLAVVVDDAAQGITDVVRGADLLDSTPRQIHLQSLFGYPTPRYLHLPLAVDGQGHKLSKQVASAPVDGNDPLPALRAALRFLDLPAAAAPSVDATLAAALAAYAIEQLPRVATRPVIALHNVARLPS